MGGADEFALAGQFEKHLEDAALVRLREGHFGLVEQEEAAVRQRGESYAEVLRFSNRVSERCR